MAELLVRDLPQDVLDALDRRAAEHGRSVEAELRLILEQALQTERVSFWEEAAALREATRGWVLTPSEDLIREGRDEPSGAVLWPELVRLAQSSGQR